MLPRQNGGGVAAEDDGNGIGGIGILGAEGLVVQRAATMGEPAHDEFVFAEQLLAVDARDFAVFCAARALRSSPM